MTARLVLPGTATEADWLKARRGGVTASEIAVVTGLSPYSSPYALYWQKTGDLPGQEDNLAMAVGRHLESFVADQFAVRRPEFRVAGDGRALWANEDRPWQLATPDRCVFESAGSFQETALQPLAVLECKTAASYDGWGDDGTDEIPVHYRCQVLWQMDVMGVTTGFVACLFLHSRQLRVYELWMGPAEVRDLDIMRLEAQLFLDRLDEGNPPEVDWRPATTGALKRLHPAIRDVDVPVRRMPVIQYRAACRAYKAAEQRKKAAENRLRLLLGDGHRITDRLTGEVVATRQVFDQREYVRKACTVDKLVPAKPKEDKP